jgi:1-acyl-sn-glycerol-3-phosphate acyltransferase
MSPRAATRDPVALRSPLAVKAFVWYASRYLARNFHAVRLAGGWPLPVDGPVIVVSNHPSWWDPMVLAVLATRAFPGRRGFAPMSATELQRYAVLARIGLFPIVPDSAAGARQFLRAGCRILAEPGSYLVVTAQGHFEDVRARPVRLRHGVAHLAEKVPEAALLVVALEYVFWNERYPEILVRFGPVLQRRDGEDLHRMLEQALADEMDRLARDARARDPGRFETVIDGSAGLGGVYDLWRRAKALARGRRFDPRHEP